MLRRGLYRRSTGSRRSYRRVASQGRRCIAPRERNIMASNRNTFIRSLHDLGAAAWFGGNLMGAVGVNGASKDVKDPAERAAVASAGWARWAPVSAAAIGAHLIGAVGLLAANRGRVRDQQGAGANAAVKA